MQSRFLTFLACTCLVLIILFQHLIMDIFGPDTHEISQILEKKLSDLDETSLTPMEKTLEQIIAIRDLCGDLCDTTKKIGPGEFIGTVTAKVDCQSLFTSPVFHQPPLLPPQQFPELSHDMQKLFTYQGRTEMREWFFSENQAAMTEPQIFTEKAVQQYIDSWLAGTPKDTYKNASSLIEGAADYVNVAGKTILVIGSMTPWVEAVLLAKKAKKVVTLEYGYYISEYPGHTFMRPSEFRYRFLNGTLDTFDAIFSYSSLEHSGIGRYGDTMNPWGGIMAVAEAWCVSTKDAHLALAVPTMVNLGDGMGKDINEWNAHTVYGPVMYPFLVTNWKFEFPHKAEDRNTPKDVYLPPNQQSTFQVNLGSWQPVLVFKKNNVGLWG